MTNIYDERQAEQQKLERQRRNAEEARQRVLSRYRELGFRIPEARTVNSVAFIEALLSRLYTGQAFVEPEARGDGFTVYRIEEPMKRQPDA